MEKAIQKLISEYKAKINEIDNVLLPPLVESLKGEKDDAKRAMAKVLIHYTKEKRQVYIQVTQDIDSLLNKLETK